MATGEDQPQPLVGQRAGVEIRFVVTALGHANQLLAAIVEPSLFSDSIDRLVTRDADDPRARIVRQSVAAPLFHRARERILGRVFREVEVAQHANQRGEYSPELVAIEALDSGGCVVHRQTRPMAG